MSVDAEQCRQSHISARRDNEVKRLPPIAAVVDFVHCVNHGDIDGLARLMTDDHTLRVFDEAPLVGREANVDAWRGYAQGFPDYTIYPERIAARDGQVAVLGRTTGSHLGLPDAEEFQLSLIWVAEVRDGLVRSWTLREDTPANRHAYALD